MTRRKPGPKVGNASKYTTGDPWLDLLVAMVKQAIKDTRKGHKGAAYWLWAVWPSLAGPTIDGDRTGRVRKRARRRRRSI